MERWEYCWSAVDMENAEACIAALDALGDEGWELVLLVPGAKKPERPHPQPQATAQPAGGKQTGT